MIVMQLMMEELMHGRLADEIENHGCMHACSSCVSSSTNSEYWTWLVVDIELRWHACIVMGVNTGRNEQEV